MNSSNKELDFYRRQTDELGAHVLRLQEELTRVRREEHRSRVAAELIREGYLLVNAHASESGIATRLLEITMPIFNAQRAAIFRYLPGEETMTFRYGLGFDESVSESFTVSPPIPDFAFKSSSSSSTPFARALEEQLATPFFLWANDERTNTGLFIGSTLDDRRVQLPFRIQDRDVVEGALGVFVEVLERRRLEDEILKASKLETVGLLAGGIAHDFNNLLTATLGNLTLARIYGAENERISMRLTEAEKAIDRARALTSQLLTFSKGGAPIRKAMSINQLLREWAAFALHGSNVRCRYGIAEDLWSVEIDSGQIGQVMHNLVINADQAMPEGGKLSIEAKNYVVGPEDKMPLENGRYVHITTRDHGVGIPQHLLSKIFDPFFTTKQKGSGLGLTMSYAIIKNHEGLLSVESEMGKGTVFHIYLPASSITKPEKRGKREQLISGKGRVLIMDDEETVRAVAKDMLEFLGYHAVLSSSGEEAIEKFVKAKALGEPYDALILDLTVPGEMGGKEVIAKLREIDPHVRAVVSSGYSADPVMAEYQRYGFAAVIPKPYQLSTLSHVMDKVVRHREPIE